MKEVLVDEKPARFVAKLLGLKPRGTIFVLLKALEGGLIDFDEFLDTLDELIRHGFRIKEDVIIEAIRKAKELQK
ncbi:DUF3368 domain-containing protein [Archaeoglobus profundus]|uniref:DUF3368 domain-containing protein n=1 Tax=Archaeoglobus profundus TaxID=84156 RepID=UPI00064FDEF9|nr:DUF3368 domain-containing protein [Archaeoglobus profundus]